MEKDELGYRALREAGSKAIQDALTKAICELTGEDYKVEVNSIDFDSTPGAWEWDLTKVSMTATRKIDFVAYERARLEETASPA